jgi:RHS repeat-associated protein
MTDRDGDPVQHYGYQPFGNERYKHNTSAFSVTNRYTGQQLDEDTGLYFYGSRYYDPALARFIQPDFVVPSSNNSQAFNRYSYCYNNPLIFTDPTGNLPILIIVAISAAINAGVAAAQGGNVWKAALAVAITGAFCGWAMVAGFDIAGVALCSAAGGALGALVTGGDPGMAAATAGISSTIAIQFKINPDVSSFMENTFPDQYIRELMASVGTGALAG